MCFQELLKCLWICKLLCKPGLTVCDFTSNIVFPSKPRTEFEYWAICFCCFKLNFQNTKCLVSRENENEENYSLFVILAGTGIPETFGKWIVIYLELSNLLVLVGSHSDELALLEDVRSEC